MGIVSFMVQNSEKMLWSQHPDHNFRPDLDDKDLGSQNPPRFQADPPARQEPSRSRPFLVCKVQKLRKLATSEFLSKTRDHQREGLFSRANLDGLVGLCWLFWPLWERFKFRRKQTDKLTNALSGDNIFSLKSSSFAICSDVFEAFETKMFENLIQICLTKLETLAFELFSRRWSENETPQDEPSPVLNVTCNLKKTFVCPNDKWVQHGTTMDKCGHVAMPFFTRV